MGAASVRVICGPTAAGKSALAMRLAERHPVTIISADSRQIYRGFDIGTAKPTAEEQQRVPHRGLDLAHPTERFSAARWAEEAREWIVEAHRGGRVPLVVGGTGFYVRGLATPLFEEPALDEARRGALRRELRNVPVAELRRWCSRLDPARAHFGRTQLLRAIEVALLTGVPISVWHRRAPRAPALALRYLVVDPKEDLERRIVERVQAMLAKGWEAEVRELAVHVPADAPAWNATGYATLREMIDGAIDRVSAVARIVTDTRRYAKRQRTWLRHQLPARRVTRLDPRHDRALERAEEWWVEPAGAADASLPEGGW